MRCLKMEKKQENEQVPVEGIVIAHELLEEGTRLIVIVSGQMQNVPRNVKIMW